MELKESKKHDILNGQCKIDYLKWYKDVYSKENDIHENGMSVNYMPFSMAYGMYVNFFDSVGIFCEDRRYTDVNMAWVVKYPNFKGIQDKFDGLTKTRQEARIKAIEKANEIYNAK